MELEFESISIKKNEGTGAILGHAGFIKTVEDLYEAMLCSVPGVKFGIAFAEASGPCLVRSEGNDEGLRTQAEESILKIGAGHTYTLHGSVSHKRYSQREKRERGRYSLLRHQQSGKSYCGKRREWSLRHPDYRWSLIARNRK